MQSYSEWILCPSKSFPGKYYYFNVRNGKAAWGPGDAEIPAARPPKPSKETETHNHPDRETPPAPDPLQRDFFTSSMQQTPETRCEVTPFSYIRQNQEIRHDVIPFSSIQQTPETRHEVNPLSSIHHPTAEPRKQNFLSSMRHTTPVFGRKTFPRGHLKHVDSNAIWAPVQIKEQIPLQNLASAGDDYPLYRDHPNILDADRWQGSHSMEGLKYTVTQSLADTEYQAILVNASAVPMHQRFVNFEAPGITFSTVNKDNIKRLNQKLKSSTPIKKSRAVQDPRLVNKPRVFESKSILNFADFKTNAPDFKPKTGNTVIKESVLNFGSFSNTNKQDLNFVLPTTVQEQQNQSCNVEPPITIPEPVSNGGPLTKSRELLLSNELPSISMNTSLNFEPPLTIKEPFVNFGLPSKITTTQPLFNLEPPIITKEPVLYFQTQTKPPHFKDGTHSKPKETVFSFHSSQKTKHTFLNLGSKTKEPSKQYLNVGPSIKTKEPVLNSLSLQTNEPVLNSLSLQTNEPVLNSLSLQTNEPVLNSLSLQTNEPVFNGQALKAKDPVLNGLPSKLPEEEIKKEPKSVLRGCVKSLKPCIKGDKGDNAVVKSFDEDLRAVLLSKRKYQDFSNAEYQGSKSKMSKQETHVKKKVTFNLDHDSISMVSSMEDAEDIKCAFVELYRPTVSYLKALAPSTQDSWWILADAEVLTEDFEFIHDFVQIDPTCKLLIPRVVHSCLLALARGCDRPLATAARNVLRRTTSTHVVVQACNEQDTATCTSDALLRCCVEYMGQNKHLVLISNDLELLTTAKCYPIPCYSMNSIKNGLPATKQLQYKKDMKITIRNDTANIKNDSAVKKSAYDDDLNEKEKAIIRNLQISKYPIGQNPNMKEKYQNDNPNGNLQNGKIVTGPNEKNQNPIKYFYHDENMRIADAIEMYRTETENITAAGNPSGTPHGTHDISNITTIQNESTDIETYFQSMVIDKSVESMNNEYCNKVKKTAESGWRPETEMTTTTIEDDIQKLCIKDVNTTKSLKNDKTVSVFFKNQKPVDLEKFKYTPKMKISFNNYKTPEICDNNKQTEIEQENQEFRLQNKVPRLEKRKSNDSIFEFCKEKIKEPPKAEFENGKTNMASQCEKTMFEFENGKTYMASQYDRTQFEDQNGKINMSSELDRSKSKMASTSNGFDVSKPKTMKSRIDLKRFYVKSKDVEHRLRARMDEWACFYTQIMEQALSTVLQSQSPPALSSAPPPPCALLEALLSVDEVYKDNTYVNKIVGHLCSCLYEGRNKMKKCIRPEEFMRALGCGAKLLEYLEIILPSIIEIQDGVTALLALLNQIEDDADPTIGLSEPSIPTVYNSKTDELDVRHNFVKDRSDVTDYLKKHFAAWRDYDPSEDIKLIKTRGKKGIKLEKRAKGKNVKKLETIDRNVNVSNVDVAHSTIKSNHVGKYSCDKYNVNDIYLFGLDRDKIGVRKENYDKKKTGAMGDRNKLIENIKYKCNKAKNGKAQDEKGPTIIRNVGILKEFETKLRKRKTKPVYVDIKPVKKSKIDVKTASNYKAYNDTAKKYGKVNDNPKNTVYRPEEDPKLIYSPRVIIEANLISDYEEKVRLKKAKKLYHSDRTEDNDSRSTKTDNEQDKYSLIAYNGKNNNNHTVTKNRKERENYDHNDNQVTKLKNKKNDHNNDDNNNNKKDVTTDSGLGPEPPRWACVVHAYTAEIEKSLACIGDMSSEQLASFRADSSAETIRMRAFEVDYLVCRTLGLLRSLLQHAADEEDLVRNIEAVTKYMAQAKSIHELANSILSVTNYL